jgi:hypothetical protein
VPNFPLGKSVRKRSQLRLKPTRFCVGLLHSLWSLVNSFVPLNDLPLLAPNGPTRVWTAPYLATVARFLTGETNGKCGKNWIFGAKPARHRAFSPGFATECDSRFIASHGLTAPPRPLGPHRKNIIGKRFYYPSSFARVRSGKFTSNLCFVLLIIYLRSVRRVSTATLLICGL